MKSKKGLAAVGLMAVVGAGLLIAHHTRKTPAPEQRADANTQGVINPDSASAGLTTEPVPQLSQQAFELPPSMGTGSYTEPAAKKDSTAEAPPQKNSVAR